MVHSSRQTKRWSILHLVPPVTHLSCARYCKSLKDGPKSKTSTTAKMVASCSFLLDVPKLAPLLVLNPENLLEILESETSCTTSPSSQNIQGNQRTGGRVEENRQRLPSSQSYKYDKVSQWFAPSPLARPSHRTGQVKR